MRELHEVKGTLFTAVHLLKQGKRALHCFLRTLAAMTLHILTFDLIGSTLVGASYRCLRTFGLMTTIGIAE